MEKYKSKKINGNKTRLHLILIIKKIKKITIKSGLNSIQAIIRIIENKTLIIVIETVNYRKNGTESAVQNGLAKETR